MTKRVVTIFTIVALWMVALLPPIYAQQQQQQQQSTTATGQDKKTTQGNTAGAKLNNEDRKFITDAAHGGMAEVALGRLALERASSDEVKQFAQRMIDDHTRANEELMKLASSKGVTLPKGHGHTTQGDTSQGMTQTTSSTTGTQPAREQPQSGQPQSGQQQSGQQQGTARQDTAGAQSTDASRPMLDKKHQAVMDRLSKLSGAEFDREYMRAMVKDHSDAVEMFQRESTRGKDAEVKAWATSTLPTIQEHLRLARELEGKTGAGTTNRD
jgi:predicted outer membrane protein